jgi:hypothetical protein
MGYDLRLMHGPVAPGLLFFRGQVLSSATLNPGAQVDVP